MNIFEIDFSVEKLFLIALLIIVGCSTGESYDARKERAQKILEKNISQETKNLIQNFLHGNIEAQEKFPGKINGPFYCMWKRKNIEISPHLALNELFRNNGYPITVSKDSLNYILISENKSHHVGTYSNGAKAAKLETTVSVIDLKNQQVYRLVSHMGGPPPNSTSNSTVDIGSHWNDKDIFQNLKDDFIDL